jgi:hypothetical protein
VAGEDHAIEARLFRVYVRRQRDGGQRILVVDVAKLQLLARDRVAQRVRDLGDAKLARAAAVASLFVTVIFVGVLAAAPVPILGREHGEDVVAVDAIDGEEGLGNIRARDRERLVAGGGEEHALALKIELRGKVGKRDRGRVVVVEHGVVNARHSLRDRKLVRRAGRESAVEEEIVALRGDAELHRRFDRDELRRHIGIHRRRQPDAQRRLFLARLRLGRPHREVLARSDLHLGDVIVLQLRAARRLGEPPRDDQFRRSLLLRLRDRPRAKRDHAIVVRICDHVDRLPVVAVDECQVRDHRRHIDGIVEGDLAIDDDGLSIAPRFFGRDDLFDGDAVDHDRQAAVAAESLVRRDEALGLQRDRVGRPDPEAVRRLEP